MVLFHAGSHAQQQGVYTNFLMNPLLYNVAYAGVNQGTQFNAGYRNQWFGFDGAPTTANFNGYGNFRKRPQMAAGGIITSERMGLLEFNSVSGLYSYHLQINDKAAINFGLSAGVVQYSVKSYKARSYDADDSYLTTGGLNGFAFDASAGFYFYTKNFFLGFSDQQMPAGRISWNASIGRQTPHFYTFAGYNFRFGEGKRYALQPVVLLRSSAPVPKQFEYILKGVYKDMIWIGFSYRENSNASVLLGCNIDKQFGFGYAYDYSVTKLSRYNTGSHEIMLSYLIPLKKKKTKSELIQEEDEKELNNIDNTIKSTLKNKKKD